MIKVSQIMFNRLIIICWHKVIVKKTTINDLNSIKKQKYGTYIEKNLMLHLSATNNNRGKC